MREQPEKPVLLGMGVCEWCEGYYHIYQYKVHEWCYGCLEEKTGSDFHSRTAFQDLKRSPE